MTVADSSDAMRELLESEPRPAPLPASAPYQPRVLAPLAAPELVREEADVREYRSSRGTPILVRPKPGALLVHAGVFALGGVSEEEAANSGITNLMVRTALKGTSTRTAPQIAEESEMLGGSISPAVRAESFGWSISVPAHNAPAAVELLADVAQHATFETAALETERVAALADVVALRDDMYRHPMRLAAQAAFEHHAYGLPPGGTEEGLKRVDSDAVRAWHAEHMVSSAAVIVLVGDADPDELAAMAARAFDELQPRPPRKLDAPRWPASITTEIEQRDRAQTALTILFPGPTRKDVARYSAGMIASVASGLGGRFFDELRDKRSLCYTVNAFALDRRFAGAFGAYIATSPEQEEAARAGLLAEFRRLREQPVTDEELSRSKTYAIGTHAIRQQNGGAVLADVVDAYLLGDLRELIEYDDRVREITAESMQRVAQEYFDPSRRAEGIVRGTGKRV